MSKNKSSYKSLTLEDVRAHQKKVDAYNESSQAFWVDKIRLLSPKPGDVLVIPAEAHLDLPALSIAIKQTSIKYALVVPQGKLELIDQQALRDFITMYLRNNPDFKPDGA